MTYRELLRRHADFRRLWAGQVVSEIGDWLNNIAVFALVVELAGRGHEGFAIALYGLARHVPLFACGPLAGVVTDRVDRKRLMIAADLMRAVLALGFFVADKNQSLSIIYFVGACLFSVSTFFNAAKRAGLPVLVPAGDALLAANSLSASTTAATIAIGSALGGVVATFANRESVFALNVASFIVSALLIACIKTRLDRRANVCVTSEPKLVSEQVGASGEGQSASPAAHELDRQAKTAYAMRRALRIDIRALARRGVAEFRDGLGYVRADAVLRSIFIVAAGWGLGNGAARALYSLFGARLGEGEPLAHAVSSGRAEDFGISVLFVAMGVGGVLGAPLARRLNSGTNLGDRMGAVLFVDGCALALFSVMPDLWSAGAALVFREICFATWWTAQQTLIMRSTTDEYAGRVFASFETLTTLAMVSSMVVCGAAADRFGMRPVAFLGGVTVALSGASWFVLRKRKA